MVKVCQLNYGFILNQSVFKNEDRFEFERTYQLKFKEKDFTTSVINFIRFSAF